jgi:thiol-disulfide isomerase/thioredoxin
VEAPHLKHLHEKYAAKGLKILAVNAWDEPRETVAGFVQKEKLPYTVLLNGRKVFRETYRGRTIPHTYLLDRSGRVVLNQLGFSADFGEALDKKIDELTRS